MGGGPPERCLLRSGSFFFIAPGNGGLLGGWALERRKDQKAEKHTQAKPEEEVVIQADLSPMLDANESQELAASLWETAAQLQSQLWEIDEYRGESLVAIYRGQDGLDLWVAVVEKDARTSCLTLRFVA